MFVSRRGAGYATYLGVLALSWSPATALADSVYWSGGVNNDWFTNGNWVWDGHTPAAGDQARIDSTGVVINGAAGAVGTLFVGITGTGSLAVQNTLTSANTTLGYNAGSQGTITVSGSLGNWTNSGSSYIGNSGTGIVNVTTGATYTGGTVYIGAASGGSGELNVSASTFSAGSVFIGYSGSGTFTLAQASTATTAAVSIADGVGSSGQAVISTSSSWTLSGNLLVGGGGVGTLEIREGSTVSGTTAAVGNTATAAGSAVTVSGAGSTWTNSGQVIIGSFGNSTMTVQTAAVVTSNGAVVGRHSTSTVSVSGSGSTWNTGYLQVGGDRNDTSSAVIGNGTLNITAAGKVTSTQAFLGDSTGSSGSATVDGSGSLWQLSDRVSVGGLGSGTLSITNGGEVRSTGGLVGHDASGSGTVTISGSGSAWNNSGVVYVGNVGDGTLNIRAGGLLTSTDGYVGTENGSDSSATIDGAGSRWTNTGDFLVAHNNGAIGRVTISNGGKISNVQGIIGNLAGSQGTLTVTGSDSLWQTGSDLNVGRLGNGTLNITLGGDVTSARSLIGNNTGSVGVATVTGDGSTWVTTGNLYAGNEGNGTLRIADGGSVSASSVIIANRAGSTGKVIIGADLGQTAAGRATLDTSSITFGAGTGSLIFNFGGDPYSLAASLSGNGSITVANGAVVYSGSGSAFSGSTAITGGSLEVNSILGGTVNVSGFGQLRGSGTVGTTIIASGGTISPGSNGVGTLTVNGNITFQTGSSYRVDINPAAGTNDRIRASGTATLNGGSVLHVGQATGYAANQTYTILTADSGVSGRFSSISSDFAFLTPTLGYDSNNVTLSLQRNSTSFSSVSRNNNQRAAATGVESLGSGNVLYNAVLNLNSIEAPGAFQQLSGEIFGTSTSVNLDNSRFVRMLGVDRIRSAFGGVGTQSNSGGVVSSGLTGYAEEKRKTPAEIAAQSILVDPEVSPPVFWAQAYGGWGRTFATAETSALSNVIGGMAIGADTAVGDSSWRVGLMAAYGRSHFEQADGLSSGDANDYDIGIYGGNRWGAVSLRLGALYKRQAVSTARTVSLTGFRDNLTADYATDTGQAFVELGYEIKAGDLRLEPFGSLAHVHLHTHGFTESGGAAALSRDASDTAVTLATLGLRSSTEMRLGEIDTLLRSSVGWQHGFGDTGTSSTVAFKGGSDFTTSGSPLVRNAFVFEAGVDFEISPVSQIGVTYNGNYSSGTISQTVKLDYAAQF